MKIQKMKIGYFADGPWSHKAFTLLQDDPSIEIAFIVPRIDTKDDTLKKLAQQHEIDYLVGASINTDTFYKLAHQYNCDLFVSMSFNQIFKSKITSLPPLQTINCHAGKLPFYRGRNILNWALINDEKEFGITVHFVDEGIDTGDIIVQECFPITDEDNYGSLLETAYEECARLLFEAIKKLQAGTYERITQNKIHPVGFVCGRRGPGDEIIDWKSRSRNIFNFIRALSNPGPIATTVFKGEEIKINKAKMIEEAPTYIGTPGQILAKSINGFIVKTEDSFIEIMEIEGPVKLKVGDKLGK